MPRVPVYQQQETLRALPNARVRAPQPGNTAAALGEGLQTAGGALGVVAARQQERANADTVFRAEAALKDEYRAFETEQRNRRGQNATGITNDVSTWFDEAAKRYNQGLANDQQRYLFDQTFGSLRERGLSAASQFEAQEQRVSLEDAAKSSIESSISTAAAQYNDSESLAVEKDSILKRIQVQAGFNGWTPERVEAETAATLTRLHAQVIESAVDADPKYAREYFAANKKEIAGTERDELQRLLDTGTLRAKAQTATDSIMAEGLTEDEALKKARANYEDDERDEIVSRIKVRYREGAAADAEREKEVADSAWDIFARTGTVSSLPTALLDELDGRTLQALNNAESGDEAENWNYFYGMLEDAHTDPEAFAERDLRKDFPNLSTAQRRQVLAVQEDLRTPENLPDAATLTQQLAIAKNLLELDDAGDKGKFDFAARQAIDAEIQRKGGKLTYEERQKVIDRMMIQGEVTGGAMFGLADPNRSYFEVAGTEDEAAFAPDIPDADRAQIVEALQHANIPATDEAIATAYRITKGLPL